MGKRLVGKLRRVVGLAPAGTTILRSVADESFFGGIRQALVTPNLSVFLPKSGFIRVDLVQSFRLQWRGGRVDSVLHFS
jgi:hypothetical protein